VPLAERRAHSKLLTTGALAAATMCLFLSCGEPPAEETTRAAPPKSGETAPRPGAVAVDLLPSSEMASSAELLAEGEALYRRQCAPCHGDTGAGDGQAAYLLYPKPRDFVRAAYRMVSTWESKPTPKDLYYTISRGMPGSAMPSWAHLGERQRWSLVHYVLSLARTPIEYEAAADPEVVGASGEGALRIPPEPADDVASRARGKELFATACAACHGTEGHGDGVQEQRDDRDFPTSPRDLNAGVYKGDPSPEGVYRRIVLGLPGSPMPSSTLLYPDKAWDLVHFVRSLSSAVERERVEMKKYNLVAPRVSDLPEHPDAGQWRQAEPVNLHLMPLWWRGVRPEELTVRALHDGNELALLLVWTDQSHDHKAIRPQDFRDAAAVQFSMTEDPPFFAMGEIGNTVNIWMWKAERQADIEVAFQDLEVDYPRLAIDSYPNLTLAGVEQPGRHALTLKSDPTFVTGWGAGNIVSDPTRRGAVEDLHAQGFGTLRAYPKPDQKVNAQGVWRAGTYRVLFRRTLDPTAGGSIGFHAGSRLPVGFAIWDGSAGDRDGKKSVTIWQSLWLM